MNRLGRLGLGCACSPPLGAVGDYDVITIGGKQYTVNQVLDKVLIAEKDVKVYSGAWDNSTVKYVTKAGNMIGHVYSYLLPKAGRSDTWLMLQTGPSTFVYVRNEAGAFDTTALRDQGILTVKEETEKEAEENDRLSDPIAYYAKKLLLPVAIGGALIYVAVEVGKELIRNKTARA